MGDTDRLSDSCASVHCGKELNRYFTIEYVEREVVPTAEGGDYIRYLARFCSRRCLLMWLRGREPDDDRR